MMHKQLVTWFIIKKKKSTLPFFIYYRVWIASKPSHLCMPRLCYLLFSGQNNLVDMPFGLQSEGITLWKGKSLPSLTRLMQCAEKFTCNCSPV